MQAVDVAHEWSALDEDETIRRALRILRSRLHHRDCYADPRAVKDFLRLQAHGLTHEVFSVMYLDARNRLITYERLFRGTLTRASVYPREVVKLALANDAAAVILHHNHPSGACAPSESDLIVTRSLQAALRLVDVHVLDHVITTEESAVSMSELGLVWPSGSGAGRAL